jgi:hypothetical protein
MPVGTLQDQVQEILGRSVAEAKSSGVLNTQIEAAALFESISLNLLLHPRTVLYFEILARNGLAQAIADEIATIDSVVADIQDLQNVGYQISGVSSLQQARNALLQIESLDKITTTSPSFDLFDSAVSNFLNGVSRSVKRQGASQLTRPADEAKVDLATDFNSLKDLHADFLDRYYSMLVAVQNFLNAPLGTILGLTTANRARLDIEAMIDALGSDNSSASARDMVTRLLGSRAALKMVGQSTSPTDPVVGSSSPVGQVLRAASDGTTPFISLILSAPVMPVAAHLQIGATDSQFPMATLDLQNRSMVVSSFVSYPVVIPATIFCFTFTASNGTTKSFKVSLSGFMTFAAVLTAINTQLGADGTAVEYVKTGTSRIAIVASSTWQQIIIDGYFVDTGVTPVVVYSPSNPSSIGFSIGQSGSVAGSTPLSVIVDAIDLLYGSSQSAELTSDGLSITGLSFAPGTSLSFSGTAAAVLGLPSSVLAKSSTFRLYGTVYGVPLDPIDPRGLMGPGDTIQTSTGVATLVGVSDSQVTMDSELALFDETPTVTSAVVIVWQALQAKLEAFLTAWSTSGFQVDLGKVDLAIAAVNGTATLSAINKAVSLLNDLRARLTSLQADILHPSTILPNGAGANERSLASAILSSLDERKFDRSVDLFLRSKVQEALNVDHDTASFAGNFLKKSSEVALGDFATPNRSVGEGLGPRATVERAL